MCDYNKVMKELAEFRRIKDEAEENITALQEELKQYMSDEGIDTIKGEEHKATYKPVESSRIDTKKLKTDLPEIASKYTKVTTNMRFAFA